MLDAEGLLECDTVSGLLFPDICKLISTFIFKGQRDELDSLTLEDGVSVLRNVGKYKLIDTMSYPGSPLSSTPSLPSLCPLHLHNTWFSPSTQLSGAPSKTWPCMHVETLIMITSFHSFSFSCLSYDRSKASTKAALHTVRYRASSFKWDYPFLPLTFYSLPVTWRTNRFNIQQLYALPTLYLCVLYLSENKQRLVPLTA